MKSAYFVIGIGLTAFGLSFFLPVLSGLSEEPVRGWEAFRIAIEDDGFYPVASACSNLLIVLVFIHLVTGTKSLRKVICALLVAASAFNSWWFVNGGEDRFDLQVGYFVWVLSFAISALGIWILESKKERVESPRLPMADLSV